MNLGLAEKKILLELLLRELMIKLNFVSKRLFYIYFTFRWSSTILLPKTTFPQRLEGEKRIKSDENVTKSLEFQDVYTKQFSKSGEYFS